MNTSKILNPKVIFLLYSVPFLFICPMIIGSIFFRFPSDQLINNDNRIDFEKSFNLLEKPNDSNIISKTVSKVDGFIEDTEEEDYTLYQCDYYSGNIISSSLSLEELSSHYLTEFTEKFTAEDFPNNVKLINGSIIKVVPINLKSESFIDGSLEIPLDEYEVKNYTDNSYAIYIINGNVNESSDSRCEYKEIVRETIEDTPSLSEEIPEQELIDSTPTQSEGITNIETQENIQ